MFGKIVSDSMKEAEYYGKKINVKFILELRGNGMGRNAIARTRHISVNSVGDVFRKADENGISYEDVRDLFTRSLSE